MAVVPAVVSAHSSEITSDADQMWDIYCRIRKGLPLVVLHARLNSRHLDFRFESSSRSLVLPAFVAIDVDFSYPVSESLSAPISWSLLSIEPSHTYKAFRHYSRKEVAGLGPSTTRMTENDSATIAISANDVGNASMYHQSRMTNQSDLTVEAIVRGQVSLRPTEVFG
jgi:hypothetical protein